MTTDTTVRKQMNEWGAAGVPFLFIIDFEQIKPLIFKLNDIDPDKLLYDINGLTNWVRRPHGYHNFKLVKHPECFEEYQNKFDFIKQEILFGNSYLLNLTCSTPIDLDLTLKEVFLRSASKYRLWFGETFVCFSPETFVTIKKGKIRSFPMKGTIDASLPDAETFILNDIKETAEHCTIVDLIRNDLSLVSKGVRVERFRYTETIETHEKRLLQVSSEICGDLDENFRACLGDIIYALLPAGSVSGAPKKKTIELIATAEKCNRGYYTGIFGVFDGKDLDSGVMIRFIESGDKGLIFRSGGGVTSLSDPLSEYNEMIDKIYVPFV